MILACTAGCAPTAATSQRRSISGGRPWCSAALMFSTLAVSSWSVLDTDLVARRAAARYALASRADSSAASSAQLCSCKQAREINLLSVYNVGGQRFGVEYMRSRQNVL